MAFENYTVKEFMDAWFKDERTVMNDEKFKECHTEYIAIAGLFNLEKFNEITYISFLKSRVDTIKISIKLQKEFSNEFKMPYTPNFKLLQKFGHFLDWKNDLLDFEQQLKSVEIKEFRYISELENCIKTLDDKNKLEIPEVEATPQTMRGSFVRMLNSLGKIGYKIDNYKTTVEELAYMIKQQIEDNEALKSKSWT